jgi:hypothetical protein
LEGSLKAAFSFLFSPAHPRPQIRLPASRAGELRKAAHAPIGRTLDRDVPSQAHHAKRRGAPSGVSRVFPSPSNPRAGLPKCPRSRLHWSDRANKTRAANQQRALQRLPSPIVNDDFSGGYRRYIAVLRSSFSQIRLSLPGRHWAHEIATRSLLRINAASPTPEGLLRGARGIALHPRAPLIPVPATKMSKSRPSHRRQKV